jgi:hypothetical protein
MCRRCKPDFSARQRAHAASMDSSSIDRALLLALGRAGRPTRARGCFTCLYFEGYFFCGEHCL